MHHLKFKNSSQFCFFFHPDGSSYQQRGLRRGWGRCRVLSDPVLHPRADRPRLDALEWRGEKERDKQGSARASSLTLRPGHYKHEDCCSTCSSSSDSEEEGFFLGQRIPLPPQLRHPQSEDGGDHEEVQRDRGGLRGSMRRRRANSLGAKDKEKNCAISWSAAARLVSAVMWTFVWL